MSKFKAARAVPNDLVTIAEFCRRTGRTDPAVRAKLKRGYWLEGVHYVRDGRRIMLSLGACMQQMWVEKG